MCAQSQQDKDICKDCNVNALRAEKCSRNMWRLHGEQI